MGTETAAWIERTGVIAVLRGIERDVMSPVVDAIADAGIDVVEITADTAQAASIIADLCRRRDDVLVGAGTVLDVPTAEAMVHAGARFVVSPTVDESVIAACGRLEVVAIPGAFTPTEVHRAIRAGADLVKVFPATTGGPRHIAALGGPLGDVALVPSGGVDAANAGRFIEAGAAAVGVGGAVADAAAIDAGRYDDVRERAAAVHAAVQEARS